MRSFSWENVRTVVLCSGGVGSGGAGGRRAVLVVVSRWSHFLEFSTVRDWPVILYFESNHIRTADKLLHISLPIKVENFSLM